MSRRPTTPRERRPTGAKAPARRKPYRADRSPRRTAHAPRSGMPRRCGMPPNAPRRPSPTRPRRAAADRAAPARRAIPRRRPHSPEHRSVRALRRPRAPHRRHRSPARSSRPVPRRHSTPVRDGPHGPTEIPRAPPKPKTRRRASKTTVFRFAASLYVISPRARSARYKHNSPCPFWSYGPHSKP